MSKGILLLQMGGPNSLAGVQEFLFNLFRDEYIIQLPWFLKPFQRNLAEFISSRRAPSVQENYKMIGGKSPILFETQCQAKALEKRMGGAYKCYIAMRYSAPFLKDTLKQMQADQIDELTVIPLYPQYSSATSGSSIIE
ncbi:MAG: ferrochelatase, partial [Candidatus Melainabacteria bacterium]|nr:ferrochelatase [Candidatus Melainabacteria bacterium]